MCFSNKTIRETSADKLAVLLRLLDAYFPAACIMFNAVLMHSVLSDEFLVTEIGYCLVHLCITESICSLVSGDLKIYEW